MHWLPSHQNFRRDLNFACAITEPAEQVAALRALADHNLGFIETIQVDRAISKMLAKFGGALVPLSVALVGGPTLDHLLPPLRVAGLRHGLLLDVKVGGYGQHRQAVLNPASPILSANPQFVLLSLTLRDLLPPVPLAASSEDVDATLTTAIEDLRILWRGAAGQQGRVVIQQTILDTSPPLFGSLDRVIPAVPSRLIAQLNDQIATAAVKDGVLLLDIAQAAARDGTNVWHDPARWLQAKQEIAPSAASRYAELLARVIAAQRGRSRKCLVLDLDNTLWGGVIGDDGLAGLVLGEGSAVGEAFLGIQHYAKALRDRGIILAVCSKNEQTTAEAAFYNHPEMVLRREDIAVFVANWDDKAANLRTIAQRLNIGLDSLVFLDDNPAERARVRQELPMVAVPELSDDPVSYVRTLADAGYFESVAFTTADLDRGQQYAVVAQREALRDSAGSMDDYLRSLDMRVTAEPFTAADLARVTQLFNKTNQFNTTTRRYTGDEITQAANTANVITLQFRLEDRFGDNGLISAMILRPVPGNQDLLAMENWVMSCRVFGRDLEYEAINVAVDAARAKGISAICATFIPTAKNGVIADLFSRLGFIQNKQTAAWLLELSSYKSRPTHIARAGI